MHSQTALQAGTQVWEDEHLLIAELGANAGESVVQQILHVMLLLIVSVLDNGTCASGKGDSEGWPSQHSWHNNRRIEERTGAVPASQQAL